MKGEAPKIIIQKFGGTSLATPKNRQLAAEKIIESKKKGFCPVVVVSAMGRKGEPYATDTLLSIAREVCPDIYSREKDLIMSCGEIISAVILALIIRNRGVESIALTGAQAGILTDNNHGQTRIVEVMPSRVRNALQEGKIPVVAGFQGITPKGEVTTIGRGGSDITASALAAALEAEFMEIYTDVGGLMSADPRIVSDAKLLAEANYDELCELTHEGAKVVHPRAVEIARQEKIPLHIRSTFAQEVGTWVGTKTRSCGKKIRGSTLITGVVSRKNIIFVKITPRTPIESATELEAFSILGANEVSVDFINIRPCSITFIIDKDHAKKTGEILGKKGYKFEFSGNYCKITVVGAGMTGVPGVMARVIEAFLGEGIPIYQTTDSLSSISCLVKEEDEERAIKALHNIFSLKEL